MNLQRIVIFSLALAMAAPAWAADPHAGTPQASPIAPKANGSAEVGKLLAPGPGDPNVPLPNRDLSAPASGNAASAGPRIYGREETGGGVLGLRFPIPVSPQPDARLH